MACVAVNCSSRSSLRGIKTPDMSFHLFPKCPNIRLEWIKAVRRDNWVPTKHSRLCSKHFEKTCFIDGLAIMKLKSDAVPTIFEGYPKYYQPVIKKRKAPLQRDSPITGRRIIDNSIENEDNPTTSLRAVLTSLNQSRKTAARRLLTIKKLREAKRRLLKKNAKLLNIIDDLKRKNQMDPQYLDGVSDLVPKSDDLTKIVLVVEYPSYSLGTVP